MGDSDSFVVSNRRGEDTCVNEGPEVRTMGVMALACCEAEDDGRIVLLPTLLAEGELRQIPIETILVEGDIHRLERFCRRSESSSSCKASVSRNVVDMSAIEVLTLFSPLEAIPSLGSGVFLRIVSVSVVCFFLFCRSMLICRVLLPSSFCVFDAGFFADAGFLLDAFFDYFFPDKAVA